MEGHGRSRKVKEGHGWSFPITGLTFQVRKVMGGGVVVGGLQDDIFSPSPSPFPLDFGFWIWDLDLGPGFGTWIWDSDLGLDLGLTIRCQYYYSVSK